MKNILSFTLLFLLLICTSSCKDKTDTTKSKDQISNLKKSCVDAVIAADENLGTIRNNESMENSLSLTIDNYVAGMRDLDFENCPPSFKTAFYKHIRAWEEMKIVTDKYPEMRGEMHTLFDRIAISQDSTNFNPLLDNIWATWNMVETAMLD